MSLCVPIAPANLRRFSTIFDVAVAITSDFLFFCTIRRKFKTRSKHQTNFIKSFRDVCGAGCVVFAICETNLFASSKCKTLASKSYDFVQSWSPYMECSQRFICRQAKHIGRRDGDCALWLSPVYLPSEHVWNF